MIQCALGIPSKDPNCLRSFRAFPFPLLFKINFNRFKRDYAAHVPSALDIPSIEPKLLCSFWAFHFPSLFKINFERAEK
jgi:hypothetical protein